MSKHTPLPTKVTLGSFSRPHTRSMRRGARVDARPTAWTIGKFRFSRASPVITFTVALFFLATSCTAAANSAGPMSEDGVVIRSRANESASTIAVARALSAPSGHTMRASALPFLLRYRSKRQAPSPIATAASVGETGAMSLANFPANFHVPGGSLVASAPKSQRVGVLESTRTAPAALPSRPGRTTRSPGAPAIPSDSIQPRRAALCSFSHPRHVDWPTNCRGKEEEERSTNGNDMAMLTIL